MPEIHYGRVVTTEEMLKRIGEFEERQRIRTKVEEMIGMYDDRPDALRDEYAVATRTLQFLLRWLDEEAS